MSIVEGKSCSVCGRQAIKQFTIEYEDDDGFTTTTYYCSSACKSKGEWKGKMILAIIFLVGSIISFGSDIDIGFAFLLGSIFIGVWGFNDYMNSY